MNLDYIKRQLDKLQGKVKLTKLEQQEMKRNKQLYDDLKETDPESVASDGHIYMSEGMVIFPDGHIETGW